MPAPSTGSWSLPVNVGQDLSYSLAWTDSDGPIDLTGYTAVWSFGKKPDTAALLEYTSADKISIDGAAGTITLNLVGADTGDFTREVRYHMHVITSPGGVETRLLEGSVQRYGEFK